MTVLLWNTCLEEWTGVPRDRILGRDVRETFPHLGEGRYASRLERLFDGGPPALFSSQLHPHLFPSPRASGRMRVLKTLAVPVQLRAEAGGYDVLLAVQDVSDLTDALGALQTARDGAERLAATDPLTGISNRRHFFQSAQRAIAHALRHERPCTLLMVDVDGFKEINDRHGHAVGDEVLRRLVKAFERTVRQSDHVARLGGDEFAILLLETDRDTAFATAERLRVAAREPLETRAGPVSVGVSIGMSSVSADAADIDGLLRRADEALYEAKRSGRDRTVVR